jgi:hypothetical protein
MGVMKQMKEAVNLWKVNNLSKEVRRTLNVALYDLYYGPTGSYEPDGDGWVYLGWDKSIDFLREKMDEVPSTAYYIPWCEEITLSEPTDEDAVDGYYEVNLRKEVLGELAEYI